MPALPIITMSEHRGKIFTHLVSSCTGPPTSTVCRQPYILTHYLASLHWCPMLHLPLPRMGTPLYSFQYYHDHCRSLTSTAKTITSMGHRLPLPCMRTLLCRSNHHPDHRKNLTSTTKTSSLWPKLVRCAGATLGVHFNATSSDPDL